MIPIEYDTDKFRNNRFQWNDIELSMVPIHTERMVQVEETIEVLGGKDYCSTGGFD